MIVAAAAGSELMGGNHASAAGSRVIMKAAPGPGKASRGSTIGGHFMAMKKRKAGKKKAAKKKTAKKRSRPVGARVVRLPQKE
jgi:hypothetical protein